MRVPSAAEYISALGHTEGEWEVTKNATMLSDGEKVKKVQCLWRISRKRSYPC